MTSKGARQGDDTGKSVYPRVVFTDGIRRRLLAMSALTAPSQALKAD